LLPQDAELVEQITLALAYPFFRSSSGRRYSYEIMIHLRPSSRLTHTGRGKQPGHLNFLANCSNPSPYSPAMVVLLVCANRLGGG
jgi:hypothetical protein